MFEATPRRVSNAGTFAILIGLTGVGLIVGALAGIVIWLVMTGKSPLNIETDMMKPENMNAVRIFQLVSTFITFFIPAWITARIASDRPFQWLGFNKRFNLRQLILAVLIMLACIPLVSALATLNELIPLPANVEHYFRDLESKYDDQVEVLSVIKGFGDYIITLMIMAILPAIFEETLFRGGMQNILTRWLKNPWAAILITSCVFSIIHLSYYGFLARFALGIILGLLYYYGRSIWLNIFAHCFNNALVVTQIYMYTLKGKPAKEAMNDNLPVWWLFVGLALVVGLMWLYRKYSDQERQKWSVSDENVIAENG